MTDQDPTILVETGEKVDRRERRGWFADPKRTVLVYVIAYVVSGALGAFVDVTIQAVLDAIFALAAVNHAVLGYRVKRTTGLVMAAVFTTRLMVVTVPATGVSLPTRTAIVASASILVAYVATWVLSHDVSIGRTDEGFPLKRPFLTRGFTSAITVASGIPIGWAAHAILSPSPLVLRSLHGSTALALLIAAFCLVIGALGEELIFRRLIAAMVQHTAQSQTPFISAALFAAAYLGTRNPAFIALTFVSGALYAWSCERTGSIKPAVTSHAIASLLVFVVLP